MASNLANTQDLIGIQNIRDNTIILKDGSLRQVAMVSGINFSLKSEDEQNIHTQNYQNFLNALNFPLQIIIHSRKINIEKYLAVLEDRRAKEPSPLLQDQISEYQEFIRGFVKDNAIMQKIFFVVIPFTPSVLPSTQKVAKFLPFLGGAVGAPKKPEGEKTDEEREREFQENLAQLKQRTDQVVEGLTMIGLEAIQLENEALVELFYNFYNPETVEKEGVALPQTQ